MKADLACSPPDMFDYNVKWQFRADVSKQHMGPIFNGSL